MSDKVPLHPVRLLHIQSMAQQNMEQNMLTSMQSPTPRASALVLGNQNKRIQKAEVEIWTEAEEMEQRMEKAKKDRNRCLSIRML